MRVLVADPVAEEGILMLRQAGIDVTVRTGMKKEELLSVIPAFDGLVVRSETQVTEDVLAAGKNLQIVVWAGVGVDNIDTEAATKLGVLVANAPTANTIAAAEHTMALMLSLARHVPKAHASMKAGEWARSKFMGIELRGKVLGVIGLGKVGSEVVRRSKSFEMRVLGYDPFVSKEYAARLGVELATMDEILTQSDFLTVHVPLTADTSTLIGKAELAKMKPTARLLNVARGGIIDEQALYEAVEAGKVAGAAVDVFTKEPAKDNILTKSDKIILTPHLGASTTEAQTNVSIESAQQIIDVMNGKPARYAVNAPAAMPEALAVLTPFMDVGQVIGKLATQLAEGQFSSITIICAGDIAQYDTIFLKAALVGGLLAPVSEERVNVVNVNMVTAQRGMSVTERKDPASPTYRNLLTVEVTTSAGTTMVAGTSVSGRTHITQINDYPLDVTAGDGGYMLLIENQDRPGMIGAVGTLAGQHDVNISFMEVGRISPRGRAMMAVGTDERMPEEALAKIRKLPGIISARSVRV